MHELSLCENIVQMIEEQAQQHHFKQVKTIYLEIGRLSCVEADAMLFAFGAVAVGTVAEDAQLDIHVVPSLGWCCQCAAEVEIFQRYDACPVCEYYPLEIKQGETMRIKDLEVI